MKKIIIPIAVFILGIIISSLFLFAEWGWPEMFNLSPQTARLCFWIILGITIALSSGLAIFLYQGRIKLWFPILQIFKAEGITTIRIEKKAKLSEMNFRRDMRHEPDSFIFPYLQAVSASRIEYGNIDVRFGCPSALPYDLKLNKPSVHFTINGIPAKDQPIFEGSSNFLKPKEGKEEYIIIRGENSNEKRFCIFLNHKMRTMVSEYTNQCKPTEIWLKVTGYDDKGKRHILETKPWTTIIRK